MRANWLVEERDIGALRELLAATKGNRFVTHRIQRNVTEPPPQFSRDEFWRVMLGCLLTTQQRAGPDSSVSCILRQKPFPMRLSDELVGQTEVTVTRKLQEFGGIRRAPTIGMQAERNLRWFNDGGWNEVERQYGNLAVLRSRAPQDQDASCEREAARFIDERLGGFGPKQSRNLWQWLGLTRYEIPVDSRVTRWLNSRVFRREEFKLSAQPLADKNYYDFVLDGIQNLCRAADVLPCVFDAAVFSTYDREWQAEDLDN